MAKTTSLTLQHIKGRVSATIFARGQSYYERGAISQCVRRGDRIEAYCRGSYPEPYQVWALLEGRQIVATGCTCEYGLTWEGDCKHIIALLLTYFHKPEQFQTRLPMHEALASRTKEDLAAIIEEMVALHPDLQRIIDRPTVREVIEEGVASDEPRLRRELLSALNYVGDWGDSTATDKIDEICRMGDNLARRGSYARALALYCLILEVSNAHDYPTDDEGEYVVAINNVIDHLDAAVDHAHLGDDDVLRRRVLDALLGAYFWDIDFGGIGYGEGATALILGIVMPGDIPYVRQQIGAAMADTDDYGYSNWRLTAFEALLTELDRLDETDPEETLERIRQQGLYLLLVDKLLSLARYDDAAAVLREEVGDLFDLIRGLEALWRHGQHDAACAIAEQRADAQYNDRLAAWLVTKYAERGDLANQFRWQLQRMYVAPSAQDYVALQEIAQALNRWQGVRSELLVWLAKQQRFDVLTDVHLLEKEWALAWETLPKVQESSSGRFRYSQLEFKVAEMTRTVYPERAIPVYMKAVRDAINRRTRGDYAKAAQLLLEVREMYRRMDEQQSWADLIAGLRAHFPRLRALQDELNQAGL